MHKIRKNFMIRASHVAIAGRNTVSPNPMVGAVIVKNNKVIGQGFHHHPGGDHAEIAAIKNAKQSVKGATLYVTLEPCYHFGRTPPCVDEIIKRQFKKVVIGTQDPNPLTNGKSIRKLRKAGICVEVGIMENELTTLNEAFFKNIRTQLPFVVVKLAQTLDGKIAAQNGHSQWISSPLARRWAHYLRDEFDAIAVGVNTILKDNPRLNAVRKKKFAKVIFDTHLRTPLTARCLTSIEPGSCLIFVGRGIALQKITPFEKKGVEVILAPLKEGKIDLLWAMKELYRRGFAKVLIEGGGQLIGQALKRKVVDKMYVVLSPKIFGDRAAISAVDGLSVKNVNHCVKLKNMKVEPLGQDLLLQADVIQKAG